VRAIDIAVGSSFKYDDPVLMRLNIENENALPDGNVSAIYLQ